MRRKQQFLKAVYQDFYKAYNPAAADRLGVVYTPNEVVDFIIPRRGQTWVLQEHFGKTLGDDNVNVPGSCDWELGRSSPTSSTTCPADRLKYKYLKEIYANEVSDTTLLHRQPEH